MDLRSMYVYYYRTYERVYVTPLLECRPAAARAGPGSESRPGPGGRPGLWSLEGHRVARGPPAGPRPGPAGERPGLHVTAGEFARKQGRRHVLEDGATKGTRARAEARTTVRVPADHVCAAAPGWRGLGPNPFVPQPSRPRSDPPGAPRRGQQTRDRRRKGSSTRRGGGQGGTAPFLVLRLSCFGRVCVSAPTVAQRVAHLIGVDRAGKEVKQKTLETRSKQLPLCLSTNISLVCVCARALSLSLSPFLAHTCSLLCSLSQARAPGSARALFLLRALLALSCACARSLCICMCTRTHEDSSCSSPGPCRHNGPHRGASERKAVCRRCSQGQSQDLKKAEKGPCRERLGRER